MPASDALFIEISPMLELSYTGIANTVCHVAKWWLNFDSVPVYFIYGTIVVSRDAVRMAVELRSGVLLRTEISSKRAISGMTLDCASKYRYPSCLYMNVKNIQGCFAYEYQVIYDLTFLITPEFHHVDTITHHGLSLADDLASNHHTFAISSCTKEDLVAYIGMHPHQISIVYPGPSLSEADAVSSPKMNFGEKIVIVPGTIEPRKNIRILFSALQFDRSLLNRYIFIFFGRSGWLQEFRSLIDDFDLKTAVDVGRILWLDFVSDQERDEWYSQADFVLYPSLYEGFGLPVLEALHVGTPVVASFSSSIPGVGGDAVFYFDPLKVESLCDAIGELEKVADRSDLKLKCLQQASKFSWGTFNEEISKVIFGVLA